MASSSKATSKLHSQRDEAVRITSLTYVLDLPENLEYTADMRQRVELVGFEAILTPTECTFTPMNVIETLEAARSSLEPQLEAWRRWTTLGCAQDWLPLRYVRATAEPWPADDGNRRVMIDIAPVIEFCGRQPILRQIRNDIPQVPPPFVIDECVEIGTSLLADSELIPRHALMCAYAFLTLLEHIHGRSQRGKRRHVAAALNVEADTLNDFGTLTSEGGEGVAARKHGAVRLEFTDLRREWLRNVFRELIRRQGQFAAQAVPDARYLNRML